MSSSDFNYLDIRFADIQMLRYRLDGFDGLSLNQKKLIYCLAEATLWGRDITFGQFGGYNLKIRKTLEAVVLSRDIARTTLDYIALKDYLRRVWFSSGIYHHYGCEKFKPGFSEAYFRNAVAMADVALLPLDGMTVGELCDELVPVIFDSDVLPTRLNKIAGDDLVATSANTYYVNVTQAEAEAFYDVQKKTGDGERPVSYGLNTTLVKDSTGEFSEKTWCTEGLYGPVISRIVYWLEKAMEHAENDAQRDVISTLIEFYRTGSLDVFDEYSVKWVKSTDGMVDFINGFIEVYSDPLGLKGSWEGIVEYKDIEATRRTRTVSDNAQWFEDHSPVDVRFRKPVVKGVTANVVKAAMLGGDEYPSTAIGINLPNADWIRAEHGSKSVTIGNLISAYSVASRESGMSEEFIADEETKLLVERYGEVCDELHTDLHECLGHGSGRLLPGVNSDALKEYGNTIEEARADLFGLYYMADEKMTELGLLPDGEAYKAHYYTYMMNGLMTQLVRIEPGRNIEEAHMRNRALVARWCLAEGTAVKMVKGDDGRTFVHIEDYARLRSLFAVLLAEVQRIKSEGDYGAARNLVEAYGVKIDAHLHAEVLERYRRLDIAPYKGFINPVLVPVSDQEGNVVDIKVDYTESYDEQMLRYGREYSMV
ncbi:dipeptidyl-peptidase 3 family protein [Xylanibacter rodentium]|jgi:dipeptidyl-peptidase-3|uniref:Dihydrofolate reductase n=2 Tax=Xylanibacter rodentium TaxID=2736289 RepID=A0ABX2AQ23_9BACT|nr:dihydrofolate reductase [Xylanibacter rodentium]NPE10145.1 dihydrofolate reductase [Prevotella sp. PJ1A]NPE12802.1 dihydrofolate reductase [Xylanibacter rodentium]NPE38421.1 dihydrofolate reductase [Prevotella sp. PCJ2]